MSLSTLPIAPELPGFKLDWLYQQPLGFVVGGIFIMTLLGLLKRSSRRIQNLEHKNDELSAALVDLLRSSLEERAEKAEGEKQRQESLLATTLTSLESALQSRRPE